MNFLFLRPREWKGLVQGHRERMTEPGKGLQSPDSRDLALWWRDQGGNGGSWWEGAHSGEGAV